MEFHEETAKTIQSRLDVLNKGLVSENNSVQYYKTLTEKTPEDTEENIGARRMYQELMEEEKNHVEKFRDLIERWEQKLRELNAR